MSWLFVLLLLLLLMSVVPAWPYSRDWGYTPSGILGIVLLVVLALVLFGYI